ncbi:hypothetical protein P171DRAFT_485298 [Karstenula rhodostoma CBS 690.94]|uniref:Uncharacterized protein n=1 Tax=Karstenula rhodostoma CBS 690.94 TaxID=1392251 RepID=A0A9P4UCH7_9PLEO|nr:hypothetical protein P171DRAFT_485298 [Karstenula rhodostoma CBS 690.94]
MEATVTWHFFNTIYNTWNKNVPDGSQQEILWPVYGASTVTDEGVACFYGDYLKYLGPEMELRSFMLNSLISFKTQTNKWTNDTGPTPRAEGNIHYIPASEKAEDYSSYNFSVIVSSNDIGNLLTFAQLRLWWYFRQCSALADGTILTLPSFEWISSERQGHFDSVCVGLADKRSQRAPTRAILTRPPPPKKQKTKKTHTQTKAIAGGAVEGVVALITAVVIALCLRRRQRQRRNQTSPAVQNEQRNPSPIDHDKYLTSPTTASYPSPDVLSGHAAAGTAGYLGGLAKGQQAYYAVPQDPLQGHKYAHFGEASAELPGTEGVVSEFPERESPVVR